jgi:hypothetical protein
MAIDQKIWSKDLCKDLRMNCVEAIHAVSPSTRERACRNWYCFTRISRKRGEAVTLFLATSAESVLATVFVLSAFSAFRTSE